MAGKLHSVTKVKSQPVEKAIAKPAMNMPIVMIIVETFSPMAPPKAKLSVVNFEASSDWLIISNQPIYCLSNDFK